MDSDALKLNENGNSPARDLIDGVIKDLERLREKRYSLTGTLYEIDEVFGQLMAYRNVWISLTGKLCSLQETKKFSHALVFFPKRLTEWRPDTQNINAAMRIYYIIMMQTVTCGLLKFIAQ